jgi:hypothetical protein
VNGSINATYIYNNGALIDLSSYAATSQLNTEQKNLTFSNPFLNASGIISSKYDNTKLNVDASGNLTVTGGTSQWTAGWFCSYCLLCSVSNSHSLCCVQGLSQQITASSKDVKSFKVHFNAHSCDSAISNVSRLCTSGIHITTDCLIHGTGWTCSFAPLNSFGAASGLWDADEDYVSSKKDKRCNVKM